MKSNKPLPETLKALLEMEGLSQRQLTKRLNERGWNHDHSTLARFVRGEVRASIPHIEAIAAGLHVPPETFVEYRLWQARKEFDPDVVGFSQAVRNLRRREQVEEPDEERHDPLEVADSLQASTDDGAQAESS